MRLRTKWVGMLIACACAVPCAATESTVRADPAVPSGEIEQSPRPTKDQRTAKAPNSSETGNPWKEGSDGADALKPPVVCQSPATVSAPDPNPGFNTLEDIVAYAGSVRRLLADLPNPNGLSRPVPID